MPRKIYKSVSLLLAILFILQQSLPTGRQAAFAQVAAQLDIASHLSAMRSAFVQDKFRPLHLRYLQYNPQENTFRLLLDKGDALKGQGSRLEGEGSEKIEEATKQLLNYFFIGLSLPNDSFWVNLRPDSPDSIIDPLLAQTDIGKVLLENDLQLKKDTAQATSPQTPEGKEYWNKLYQKAGELFGNENVTIPTLTRPWIVPDEIIIRETTDSAYVYKATLKVMLEQDYLHSPSSSVIANPAEGGVKQSLSSIYNFSDPRLKALNEYSSQLIRELIIPKLTKEVNSSKRYASLRQVYYSLIMAQWFKARFTGKDGQYAESINTKNLANLTCKEPYSKDTYFKEYQKSFKDGEYNIKESAYTAFGQVIRSYFSGGMKLLAIFPAQPGGTATEQVVSIAAQGTPAPVSGPIIYGYYLNGEIAINLSADRQEELFKRESPGLTDNQRKGFIHAHEIFHALAAKKRLSFSSNPDVSKTIEDKIANIFARLAFGIDNSGERGLFDDFVQDAEVRQLSRIRYTEPTFLVQLAGILGTEQIEQIKNEQINELPEGAQAMMTENGGFRSITYQEWLRGVRPPGYQSTSAIINEARRRGFSVRQVLGVNVLDAWNTWMTRITTPGGYLDAFDAQRVAQLSQSINSALGKKISEGENASPAITPTEWAQGKRPEGYVSLSNLINTATALGLNISDVIGAADHHTLTSMWAKIMVLKQPWSREEAKILVSVSKQAALKLKQAISEAEMQKNDEDIAITPEEWAQGKRPAGYVSTTKLVREAIGLGLKLPDIVGVGLWIKLQSYWIKIIDDKLPLTNDEAQKLVQFSQYVAGKLKDAIVEERKKQDLAKGDAKQQPAEEVDGVKKLYKQICTLSHPDLFAEQYKKQAEEFFKEVQEIMGDKWIFGRDKLARLQNLLGRIQRWGAPKLTDENGLNGKAEMNGNGRNVSCGTICESGHEGIWQSLDSQLERQFTELRAAYNDYAKQNGLPMLSDSQELTEEQADRALVELGYVDSLGALQILRERIRQEAGVPQSVGIFFSSPESGKNLFWVNNDYAAGHFNRAGTRIHISLPVALRDPTVAIGIAQHEMGHINGQGHQPVEVNISTAIEAAVADDKAGNVGAITKPGSEERTAAFKKMIEIDLAIKREMSKKLPSDFLQFERYEKPLSRRINTLVSSFAEMADNLSLQLNVPLWIAGAIKSRARSIADSYFNAVMVETDTEEYKKAFEIYVFAMRAQFVSDLNGNIVGYLKDIDINFGDLVNQANTFNELLLLVHQYILVNNNLLEGLHQWEGFHNRVTVSDFDGNPGNVERDIKAYGERNELAMAMFEAIKKNSDDLDATEILMFSFAEITHVIARGYGHALSLEITLSEDKRLIRIYYHVPKVFGSIAQLPGDPHYDSERDTASGIINVRRDILGQALVRFIQLVPTDFNREPQRQPQDEKLFSSRLDDTFISDEPEKIAKPELEGQELNAAHASKAQLELEQEKPIDQMPPPQEAGTANSNGQMGGIDFRNLPIVTQAVSNLSVGMGSIPLIRLNAANLVSEWQQIEHLVTSGITPSGERIKEYLQASCYNGHVEQDKKQVVICISNILRMEEERYVATEPVLRDILIVLESGQSAQQLRAIFMVKESIK